LVEPVALQCRNPVCKISQTQKCVEGLAIDVCPHYGRPPASDEAQEVVREAESVALPSGNLLDPEEASQVLRRGESRVIAVVGPREAGKTTLISSLFELFLRGPLGSAQFAGSRTMYAFERACHPSRGVSRNAIPQTERTLLTDVQFYHLATRVPEHPVVDFLIADRGGEDYRSAADDGSGIETFVEIRRADTITFLVDGYQLLSLETRSSVGPEMLSIAQALIDGEAVSGMPRAAIVLTKLDEIERSSDRDRAMADYQRIVDKFRDLYGGVFEEIAAFHVAACPSDTALPLGHGVVSLFEFWGTKAPGSIVDPAPYVSTSTRFMDLLQE
jgi:hypothetical protein